jgi:pSer/pThr/pTyr-binding forkhead associated (FHA) protein
MKLNLEVLTEGKQKGKLLPIPLPQFVIGRDPQCHLRPASPSISKRHCAILQRDGRAFVRDFDSTNGTFVNERQIKGEIELQNGDQLRIGPIMFTVHLEAGAPVNRPTPTPPTKGTQKTPEVKKTSASKQGDRTPVPATKPETSPEVDAQKKTVFQTNGGGKDPHADDDVADMLLSMGDDNSTSGALTEIPEGSTVMDLPIPPGALDSEAAKKEKEEKEKPKPPANTQNAAKEILDKYMKRPR